MENARVLQMKYRRCGRNCRGCPHGPYWYWAQRVNGRVKWTYIGTEAPKDMSKPENSPTFNPILFPDLVDQPARVFPPAQAHVQAALQIAELPGLSFFEAAKLLEVATDRELPKREVLRKRVWNRCKAKKTSPELAKQLKEALDVVTAWLDDQN